MGYMGLGCVWDSDVASELAHMAILAQVKVLEKGLKVRENCWNTSGPENVGLFFEEFIIPTYKGVICDELYDLARATSKALDQTIEDAQNADWGGVAYQDSGKAYHLKAYRRLKRKIDNFIKRNDS